MRAPVDYANTDAISSQFCRCGETDWACADDQNRWHALSPSIHPTCSILNHPYQGIGALLNSGISYNRTHDGRRLRLPIRSSEKY
jgi:hypothetical protein